MIVIFYHYKIVYIAGHLNKNKINMKIKNLQIALIAFIAVSFQLLSYKAEAQMCFTPATTYAAPFPQSVINADFNNDGNADLAITDSTNYVSVFLGDGAGGFGPITYFMVGNEPVSVTSSDFDGDGNADLAVANNWSQNVSVLLGDGLGGFGTATNIIVSGSLRSIISADFNNDGKADLAMANGYTNQVSLLLGDGGGGFSTPAYFPVGTSPQSVISGDFNGDGKVDLASADSSNQVSIILGNGTGGFGAATSFSAGNGPQSMITADFNGDSKADLAIVNIYSDNISILMGNGAGSFSAPTDFTVENHPTSIVGADFDADGKIDLAVANYYSTNISIMLGNGLGSFGAVNNFAVGSNPLSLTTADFNGDGNKDLATASNVSDNGISVLLSSPAPPIIANASASIVCAGTSVILTGSGASTYSWTGGVTDGLSFIPSSTLTYTVTGTTLGGCTNTATKTITVNPLPTATFATHNESSSLYCDGSIQANLAGGTGTILAQWDSASTVLSNTDSIGFVCPGTYTLHLTDANNCSNTYSQIVQAGPIPPAPPICLVTVDSTLTHNLLVWEKTNLDMTPVDSFVVYREITTNNYQRIGAVSHNSLSTFNDLAANPASTGYRYKLKSKNNMGVTSLFSGYHNTIYLTNTGGNFNWTPYQIENNTTPVSSYNVYRDDISTGNFQLIGNTTGNQFGYTDVQFANFPNAQYYVEAIMAGGVCNPTRSGYAASRSNVKHIGTSGVQQLNNPLAINIYPNPAGNTLNITGITGKSRLRLYDVIGKLVLEAEVVNNITINTSQLPEGIYTILTENKSNRTFNKVVISH